MGRHWLDLARYADSDGYSIDAPRPIWKYRDWVINALNRDMPFDQFTIEQIAGDLLPHPTIDQLIATGFHRNTPSNFEGGIDLEQYRVEAVVDRTATTGSVFLGLDDWLRALPRPQVRPDLQPASFTRSTRSTTTSPKLVRERARRVSIAHTSTCLRRKRLHKRRLIGRRRLRSAANCRIISRS